MSDAQIVALIVGAYAAVLANVYFIYKVSNHWGTKLDSFKDAFNDFRVEISKDIGEIKGKLDMLTRGGRSGGEG